MGFQDDLAAETRARAACKVSILKEQMDQQDRDALEAAMANRDRVPNAVIIRALNRSQDEITVGEKAMRKHRDQLCSCFSGDRR